MTDTNGTGWLVIATECECAASWGGHSGIEICNLTASAEARARFNQVAPLINNGRWAGWIAHDPKGRDWAPLVTQVAAHVADCGFPVEVDHIVLTGVDSDSRREVSNLLAEG